MNRNARLILVGLILAVIIASLAPFLASSNPDGLESAAEGFHEAEGKEASYYEAPMPDYVFPGMGSEGAAGVVAIVSGTILLLVLGLGVLVIVRKQGDGPIFPREG
ncbi:MAG: PDGLE domain-containing protein [Thermoplasmata archaeon]|nr:PDGLE domain-containing protein [Thermoplasmata archaeon]